MHNPFGNEITPDEIVDTLSFFDSWEDRYKYIIDLGKQLPGMADELKTEQRMVRGCQSQVWIEPGIEGGKLVFQVDSDAHIVRGLLAVVMSAYNNKSAADIQAYDIEGFFAQLDLLKHLSQTRGNGLRAMVQRIRDFAASQN
jgi:cysteine desulfuration protein SufE